MVSSLLGIGVTLSAAPAAAEDGGYPSATMQCIHAPYKTTGTGYWCSGYSWGTIKDNDSGASIYSARGYAYRNCTDYVAWKLESQGISSSLVRGRGNGGQWDDSSTGVTVTTTPEVGDAAVMEPWATNAYGHVAYVEAVQVVSGKYQVKVSQYNWGQDGNYSMTGWQNASTYGNFVDFNGVNTPLGGGSTGSGNVTADPDPLVTSLVTSDGVRHVYSGTSSGRLYETWWSASSPSPTTWELMNVGSPVTAISAQATADGNEHVYYGTQGGQVGEVWWGPNSNGVHLGQTYSTGAVVTTISSQVTSDGIQHVYSANAAGSVYETWWGSNPATTWQVANVGVNVVSISSIVTSDGTQHIFYGATNGQVGEVWWNATSNGGHLGFTSNVGTNVTSVTSQITSDGVRHIYSAAADGGLYETWWGYTSTGATTWQLANVGHHPTSVSSQVTSDGTQHVYYGTSFGQVGEVWWNANSNGVHLGQTYSDPAGVGDTSVSSQVTSDGSQNVFFGNDAGSLFGMSWGANPATTASLGSVG
ncbi:CHAP domain-containing protein [Streptomyces sp. cg40]|uniref:CHAP domain-containing protein n=1 Tax=Streptomyces sp. cg40 TaxID=3419764 RepID=UPI003D064593